MTTQTIARKPTDTHLLDVDVIEPRLREYRCFGGHCKRLLFRGYLPAGAEIEVRCPNCHRTRTFYGPSNGKTRKVVVAVNQHGETVISDVTGVNTSISDGKVTEVK